MKLPRRRKQSRRKRPVRDERKGLLQPRGQDLQGGEGGQEVLQEEEGLHQGVEDLQEEGEAGAEKAIEGETRAKAIEGGLEPEAEAKGEGSSSGTNLRDHACYRNEKSAVAAPGLSSFSFLYLSRKICNRRTSEYV